MVNGFEDDAVEDTVVVHEVLQPFEVGFVARLGDVEFHVSVGTILFFEVFLDT